MKSLDAAFEVLRDAGPRGLHCRDKDHELTDLMISRGLWQTTGKTPWATVAKNIQVDIRKHGEASRFRQVAPGVFGLNKADRESPAGARGVSPTSTSPPVGETTAGTRAAATRAAGQMSFADAAEQVLRDSGSREPMHYEEITDHAINRELIQPEGKTPAVSLNSIIGTEIRQREARGEQQRFVRHGRGLLGLAEWLPLGLNIEIAEHNREVRGQLLERARRGSPAEFEQLVATLLLRMGFDDAKVTPLGGDGGIDVHGTLVIGNVVRIRMAVQAKRWKNNVTAPVVQQVRGSLGAHEQGLIITTSDFSKGAREEAERADASPVALMSGEQLADLLAEHEVGVERESHTLFRLLEAEAASL